MELFGDRNLLRQDVHVYMTSLSSPQVYLACSNFEILKLFHPCNQGGISVFLVHENMTKGFFRTSLMLAFTSLTILVVVIRVSQQDFYNEIREVKLKKSGTN